MVFVVIMLISCQKYDMRTMHSKIMKIGKSLKTPKKLRLDFIRKEFYNLEKEEEESLKLNKYKNNNLMLDRGADGDVRTDH